MIKYARICIVCLCTILAISCDDPSVPAGDTMAPNPGNGGLLACSNPQALSVTVGWTAASDDVTTDADLSYRLFYSSSGNISTVSDAESNGTPAGDWTKNAITLTVDGLTSCKTFHFNVLVRDESGNTAAYAAASGNTLYIVDDFEDGDLFNYVNPGEAGGGWGGRVFQSGDPDEMQVQITSINPGGGARSLHASGFIVANELNSDDNYYGYYYVNAFMIGPVDAGELTGIRFKVKVDAVTINPPLVYGTEYVDGYLVGLSGDYEEIGGFQRNSYRAFTPTTGWQILELPFSSFTEGDDVSEVLPTLGAIIFRFNNVGIDSYQSSHNFYIDDLEFY